MLTVEDEQVEANRQEADRQLRYLRAMDAVTVKVSDVEGTCAPLLDARGLDEVAATLHVPGRTTRFMSVAAVRASGMGVVGQFDPTGVLGPAGSATQLVASVPYGAEVVAAEIGRSRAPLAPKFITPADVEEAAAVANAAAERAHLFWSLALTTAVFDPLLRRLHCRYGMLLGVRVEVPTTEAAVSCGVAGGAPADPPLAYVPFSAAAAARRQAGVNVGACVRVLSVNNSQGQALPAPFVKAALSTLNQYLTLHQVGGPVGAAMAAAAAASATTGSGSGSDKPGDEPRSKSRIGSRLGSRPSAIAMSMSMAVDMFDSDSSGSDSDSTHSSDSTCSTCSTHSTHSSDSTHSSHSSHSTHSSCSTCSSQMSDGDGDGDGEGTCGSDCESSSGQVNARGDQKPNDADRPADVCMVPLEDGTSLLVRTDGDADTDSNPTCTIGGSTFRKWLAHEFETVDATAPPPVPRCKQPKSRSGTLGRSAKSARSARFLESLDSTAASSAVLRSSGLGCLGLVSVLGCGMPPNDTYSPSATRLVYEVFQSNPRVRDWATVLKTIDAQARAHAGKKQQCQSKWGSLHPAAGTGAAPGGSTAVTVQQPVIYIVNGSGTAAGDVMGMAGGGGSGAGGTQVYTATNPGDPLVMVPASGTGGTGGTGGSGGTDGTSVVHLGGRSSGDGSGGANGNPCDGNVVITQQQPAIYIVSGGECGPAAPPAALAPSAPSAPVPSGPPPGPPSVPSAAPSGSTDYPLGFLLFAADFALRNAFMQTTLIKEGEKYVNDITSDFSLLQSNLWDKAAASRWFRTLRDTATQLKSTPSPTPIHPATDGTLTSLIAMMDSLPFFNS
jgi:hypothetical protein